METSQAVFEYLNAKGWVSLADAEGQVRLQGRGENNQNFLITSHDMHGESRYVLRVNHSSRLGLTGQAEYEFGVLQALSRSGVTPRPFYWDCEACASFCDGVILMEYLPGRPFNYAGDWKVAARTFAAVHSQPVDGRLLVTANPIGEMLRECAGLADRFDLKRHAQVRAAYMGCMDDLRVLEERSGEALADDASVIVHGAPFASDFIVDDDGERGWLVDWEGAMISNRSVDLGRFMAHAAMAGEMGFCHDREQQGMFLQAYLDEAGLDLDVDAMVQRAALFGEAAELRAMIWNCVALTGNIEGMRWQGAG